MPSSMVDAGLSLNPLAVKELRQAAERTGFLRNSQFICEVYPAKITDEHLGFLKQIGTPLVGVGIQSFDKDVLSKVERSYDESKFETNLFKLVDVAEVALEIILGLPGDNRKNFRACFERARSLPCALRVYHCVVLPSALMVRAPASYEMDYDLQSLKMRSCLGWPEDELAAEVDFLNQQADLENGSRGEFFWVFPPRYHP